MEQSVEDKQEEGSTLVLKKMDHNAKERIRRMKLNASYLALRALLPDSKRSKKRLGVPAVVDRVLKYIPEMENEIEELRSNKQNLQSAANDMIVASSSEYVQNDLTVTVNKVNEEEAIVQICMANEDNDDDQNRNQNGILAFTNLLQGLEDDHDQGIFIKTASINYVCDTRICYHLHIQINKPSSGADYIQELRNKVISLLR